MNQIALNLSEMSTDIHCSDVGCTSEIKRHVNSCFKFMFIPVKCIWNSIYLKLSTTN